MTAKLYSGPSTRDVYPDDAIPGWLRAIRDGGASVDTARSAFVYGSERRTRAIAAERLDAEAGR